MAEQTIAAHLQAAFDDAGVEGYLHAVELEGGGEVRYRSDHLNHPASMAKVPIMVALMRSVAAGEHRLDERTWIPDAGTDPGTSTVAANTLAQGRPASGAPRTLGPTGLSVMKHAAELSLRDVAQLMIAVSDNHATDVVLGLMPPARVTAAMRELGLQQTTIDLTIVELFERMQRWNQGYEEKDEAEQVARMRADPELQGETASWRTTAEELTRLLTLIWRDQATTAALCAEMREIMYSQVWPHRLSSGFPDGVRIGGKTGTLRGIRNECGVVEYPDGKRYAVAVFTRTDNLAFRNPPADRVIGTAARLAIDHLRAQG